MSENDALYSEGFTMYIFSLTINRSKRKDSMGRHKHSEQMHQMFLSRSSMFLRQVLTCIPMFADEISVVGGVVHIFKYGRSHNSLLMKCIQESRILLVSSFLLLLDLRSSPSFSFKISSIIDSFHA